MLKRVIPDGSIDNIAQSDFVDVLRSVTAISEHVRLRRRQLRVDQEPHRLRRGQDRMVGLRCCVPQARLDIVGGQIRVVRHYLLLGPAQLPFVLRPVPAAGNPNDYYAEVNDAPWMAYPTLADGNVMLPMSDETEPHVEARWAEHRVEEGK